MGYLEIILSVYAIILVASLIAIFNDTKSEKQH